MRLPHRWNNTAVLFVLTPPLCHCKTAPSAHPLAALLFTCTSNRLFAGPSRMIHGTIEKPNRQCDNARAVGPQEITFSVIPMPKHFG
jgi:hypothetical protein